MSNYVKQNFVSGQVLKAEHMNYIEAGIEQLSNPSWNDLADRPFGETTVTSNISVPAGKSTSFPFPKDTEFTVSCDGSTKTLNSSDLSSGPSTGVGPLQLIYSPGNGLMNIINNNPNSYKTATFSYTTLQQIDEKFLPVPTLRSPSGTLFKLTVDDSGTISAVNVTE